MLQCESGVADQWAWEPDKWVVQLRQEMGLGRSGRSTKYIGNSTRYKRSKKYRGCQLNHDSPGARFSDASGSSSHSSRLSQSDGMSAKDDAVKGPRVLNPCR